MAPEPVVPQGLTRMVRSGPPLRGASKLTGIALKQHGRGIHARSVLRAPSGGEALASRTDLP